MDTGIGTESYSVMEQGKVDLILSSRPEDRRFVLEEAAGIAKYNARRDAALRKLELTNQNLLRIDDIIAEVKREIISIKRQATKAEKYKESYERLKTLDIGLTLKKYRDIKSEIEFFQGNINRLKADTAKLNTEMAEEESKEEVLHLKVIDMEKALTSARDKFLASAERVNSIENKNGTLKERMEHLKERAGKAHREIGSIREKTLDVRKRIETEENEERKIFEDIKGIESSLAEKENAFISLRGNVEDKEKELEDYKNKIFEKVRGITSLNNEIKKLNTQFTDANKHLTKKSTLLSRLNLLIEWDKAQENYRHSIRTILKEIEKITGRSRGLIAQLIGTEMDLNLRTKKEEIKKIREEVEGEDISFEAKNLKEEKPPFDAILVQKKEAIETLEKEREYLKEELDKKTAAFQPLKKSLEEAREATEKVRLSLAGLQEKKKGIELHLKTLKERLFEYNQTQSRLEEEIKLGISENDTLGKTIEELKGEKDSFLKEKEVFKNEMEKLDEERKKAAAVFRGEEERLRKERVTVNKRMQELHNLEISRTEKQAELTTLKERVSNLYQVDMEAEPAQDKLSPQPGTVNESSVAAAIPDNEEEVKKEIEELRRKIGSMGSVNLMAIEENKELEDRFSLLKREREDILKAKEELQQVISRIKHTCREKFSRTLEKVREEFHKIFRILFRGGKADLILQEGDILESGIDIVARPPGKNLSTITQLSGGEKALTAIALLFALFRIRPSPFCVLDEIDAPLDDSNIGRFGSLIKDFLKNTQFIIITHSKKTISLAQAIYGITMQEPGISKIISMKFTGSRSPEADIASDRESGAELKDAGSPEPSPI
jgi:chromosome segregation protein